MFNPQPKPLKVKIDHTKGKCKQCGKEFELFRSYRSICSYECGKKYDAASGKVDTPSKTIKKQPLKKPTKKLKTYTSRRPYTAKANAIIQFMVDNDGYAYCQKCKRSDMKLDCHHICLQSEFPKHKNLHHLNNLIIVCRECHEWFHSKRSNRDYLIKERNLTELFGRQILSKKI